MTTIRHRIAQLEQRRAYCTLPTITIHTDHSVPFTEGYDAEGSYQFTIVFERRDDAAAIVTNPEEQEAVP